MNANQQYFTRGLGFTLYKQTGPNEFTQVNYLYGNGDKQLARLLSQGLLPVPTGAKLIDIDLEEDEDDDEEE